MEDDIDLLPLVPLRDLTKAQVDLCTDVYLLDFVYKLLISEA